VERDEGQYDNPVPVFWASGACFFVRTEVFRQLGGFDPLFYAHMEEIDLCWRMQAASHQIYYQPKSVVYHVGGGTMPATNPRKTYLNFRNSTGMLYKNTPGRQLWYRVLLKLSLDGVAALRFLLRGKLPDAWAVLRAMFDFLRQHSDWKDSRDRVTQKLGESPVMMHRLLVVERYLKGKKLFSELNFGPKG
jgi:GT2 family glycosyltransferase